MVSVFIVMKVPSLCTSIESKRYVQSLSAVFALTLVFGAKHIISFILHIDSSEDAEPWPIFIEDFQGRTHEVILTPGDILFYESSKCFHGRPRPLSGSW